jgi:hypothetical protein
MVVKWHYEVAIKHVWIYQSRVVYDRLHFVVLLLAFMGNYLFAFIFTIHCSCAKSATS